MYTFLLNTPFDKLEALTKMENSWSNEDAPEPDLDAMFAELIVDDDIETFILNASPTALYTFFLIDGETSCMDTGEDGNEKQERYERVGDIMYEQGFLKESWKV